MRRREKKIMLKEGQQVNNNGSVSNEIEVLNGVDLRIRKGEFLVMVGPSGCGNRYMRGRNARRNF